MKLRLGKWRPVGSVQCPRCGEAKQSGGYQSIQNYDLNETRRELMCDECRETFVKWYRQREDETGMVNL